MGPGRVLELFGMPSAGKSTIARAVAERLRAEGQEVYLPRVHNVHSGSRVPNTLSRLHMLARETLLDPACKAKWLLTVRATRQKSPADFRTVLENLVTVAKLAREAHRTPGIHVFDQGLAQAIWSVGLSAQQFDAASAVAQLAAAVPLPHVLAVVSVSLGAVRERLAARPVVTSRLGHRLPGDPALLDRASEVFDAVRAEFERFAVKRGVDVITLRGDEPRDLDASIRCVVEALSA